VTTPALRVLVVDDDPDTREVLRVSLSLQGHEVFEAADGPAAIQAVEDRRPQAALIDIGLPGLDGYEVARRIRAAAAGRHLLLIALTGYGQPDDRRRAEEAGFDRHLVKPVDPGGLAKALSL
jgi:CheY-like chemotaxis protein